MRIFWLVFLTVSLFAQDALEILNSIRIHAGLAKLQKDSHLMQAAKAHVRFEASNAIFSHFESPSYKNFYAKTPKERAFKAGALSGYILENISHGQENFAQSITSLMGAIYHRFVFLSPYIDRVGYAKEGAYYCYDFGIHKLEKLCRSGDTTEPSFMVDLCADGTKVGYSIFNRVTHYAGKPIVWPYDGMREVPVIFYEEIPDPLPDRKFSGYPVSVQFADGFKRTDLMIFRLYHDGKEIPTILLDAKSDPNSLLKESQFALFPLRPLDFNTRYDVVIRYKDSKTKDIVTLRTHFFTKKIAMPIVTLDARRYKPITLFASRRYLLYLRSDPKKPLFFRYIACRGKCTYKMLGPNMMIVQNRVKNEGKITLYLSGEEKLTLKVVPPQKGRRD